MEDVKHSFKNTLKENLALAVYNTAIRNARPGIRGGRPGGTTTCSTTLSRGRGGIPAAEKPTI